MTRQGEALELTGTEYELLLLLAREPGRVFSRDDISRVLHGRDWFPLDRTIDGHVARLRRKLPPEAIETVRGLGYRLAAAPA